MSFQCQNVNSKLLFPAHDSVSEIPSEQDQDPRLCINEVIYSFLVSLLITFLGGGGSLILIAVCESRFDHNVLRFKMKKWTIFGKTL